MATTVDAVLEQWEDRLFYKHPKKGRVCVTVTGTRTTRTTRTASVRSPQVLRSAIRAAGRRAPEVMVKLSGVGHGAAKLRAHLDYISRNGQLSLETDEGQAVEGRTALRDLADEWKYGRYGIPEESNRRETMNIVLSMPPGSDRAAVRAAAAEFARDRFGGERSYVFVAHNDEKHPHVHLCVKVMGHDGTRLNPRKADLQLWREEFAHALRSNGIDASATPRSARGSRQRTVSQSRYHARGALPLESQSIRSVEHPSERSQLASTAKLAGQLASTDREGAQLALDLARIASRMANVRERLRGEIEPTSRKEEDLDHRQRRAQSGDLEK